MQNTHQTFFWWIDGSKIFIEGKRIKTFEDKALHIASRLEAFRILSIPYRTKFISSLSDICIFHDTKVKKKLGLTIKNL